MNTDDEKLKKWGAELEAAGKIARRCSLSFTGMEGQLLVAAGNCTLQIMAEDDFYLERLLIPNDIAWSIRICDLRIGDDLVFGVEGSDQYTAIPGQFFSEFQAGVIPGRQGHVIKAGQSVRINVTNCSTEPLRFHAALFGFLARKKINVDEALS